MTRFGFGDKTGESEKGGLDQYEDGHVEVSGKALKHAIEKYPGEPPREAVGRMLAGDSESDGSERLPVNWDDVRASVEAVDGVGDAVADSVVEALQDHLEETETEA